MKNKYNEIMDHVKVDAAMKERVLQAALLKEYEGEEETLKQSESTENEELLKKETEPGEEGSERKKDRKVSFRGRMNRMTAAAAAILVLALVGIGFVTVTMKSGSDSVSQSATVAEETEAAAEDAAVKTDDILGDTEVNETTGGEGGTVNEAAEAAAVDEEEESLYATMPEDTAPGIEENSDMKDSVRKEVLQEGDEISVTEMTGMVSEPVSAYIYDSGGKTSLTVPGIILYGCEGELELKWEKDVVLRVLWTESDSTVSFSRLADKITAELGLKPEKIKYEDADGQDGSEEASSDESYVYVWMVNGKTVTLGPDLQVEVMP